MIIAAFALFLLSPLLLAETMQPLTDSMPVVTQEMVDHINSQGMWKASLDWVGSMTMGEAKRLTTSKTDPEIKHRVAKLGALENYLSIPASFDSRVYWPGCIGQIRNQGNCGCSNAFAATEVLADRYCISWWGLFTAVFSPQFLLDCDSQDIGCSGGNQSGIWEFLESYGVPTDNCYPYVSGVTTQAGSCGTQCDGKIYSASNIAVYTNPAAIQAAILAGGPVHALINVYQDFYSYKNGIYTYTSGQLLGGLGVKIVGWGNYEDTNYWIVANAWDIYFGMEGIIYIAFGQIGIEASVYAGDYAG